MEETSSESGMQEALGKIDAINLEALNQSIEDFSAVVEPLGYSSLSTVHLLHSM